MSFLLKTMSTPEDVAMDDSASMHIDVSSGGDWPAGSTSGFGVDVVDQQQFRAAALQWHQCSQPVASHPGSVVSPHHHPGRPARPPPVLQSNAKNPGQNPGMPTMY